MIREIYCKLTSDPNYKKNIESQNEIENILQQCRVVLGTKKGQVLGSYEFGMNLDEYLFKYNFNEVEVLYRINQMLASYVYYNTQKYTVFAQVSYGKADDTSDYAVVDIYINDRPCLGILVAQT